MSDFTLPLIGLTTFVGYLFSKNGNPRKAYSNEHRGLEAFERPNGATIYSSNKVEEVNAEMLERSKSNYKKAEDPASTGVIPPMFNALSTETYHTKDIDRTVDVTVPMRQSIDIERRPMFKDQVEYIGRERVDKDDQTEISLLTGKAIDREHNNMVPYFGSNIKQNVETFQNESILDRHTGNTSTFRHKSEVKNMFEEQAEDIHGPIFSNAVQTDRYIPSLYRQNEKPFDDKKVNRPIAGTIDNTIKPVFKDVNELRVGNRLKESYDGRTIHGKRGEVRGVQSEFVKRRPPTFYEQSSERLLKTTGHVLGERAKQDYSTNFKATSREDYNMEYYGAVGGDKLKDKQRVDVQESKRQNFSNDYSRNVKGETSSTHDYGKSSMTPYETERATTDSRTHALNVNKVTLGKRTQNQDLAKATIKETTLIFDNSGNVKTKFDMGRAKAFDSGVLDIVMRPTHKESTINKNYKGMMQQSKGMGYTVNKYDARATNKESLQENGDYQGNPNLVMEGVSRGNFDNAEIRSNKEHVVSGERPSGPQHFQIGSGVGAHGEIKTSWNMMLKERDDDRDKMNVNMQRVIPTKESVGYVSRWNVDDEKMDTVHSDRLQPDLVQQQHDINPFSMYSKKKYLHMDHKDLK
jgi:hypothetical protein